MWSSWVQRTLNMQSVLAWKPEGGVSLHLESLPWAYLICWSGCWILTRPSPCCCRNYLFVVLHIALQAAVYAEYTWEVFVYCWELEFHLVLLLLPYLLLLGNVGCFILCSCANPGKLMLNVGCGCLKIEPLNVDSTNTFTFLSCFFHRYNNKIKSCITDEDLCVWWCVISERHCVCYMQRGKASQIKTLQ